VLYSLLRVSCFCLARWNAWTSRCYSRAAE